MRLCIFAIIFVSFELVFILIYEWRKQKNNSYDKKKDMYNFFKSLNKDRR